MAAGPHTGRDLMERAGQAAVAAILRRWPGLATAPGCAVVLAGPGNNGGDGYVMARRLAARGWDVRVYATGDSVTGDAQAARASWTGPVQQISALDWDVTRGASLCIDALFGAGLGRAVAPELIGALVMAQQSGCIMVAVDMPTGLCADSGAVRAECDWLAAPMDLTVTFERPRRGQMLEPAASLCGTLVVVPIGIAAHIDGFVAAQGPAVVDLARVSAQVAKRGGHKYDHGHALVLSGGPGQGGAARLAARAALRVGAGLVTLAPPPDALAENAARLDAVMLHPLADAQGLATLLADPRVSALCLGPGLGLGPREAALAGMALDSDLPCVLDADALTLLARDKGLVAKLHPRCVLTPHGGEFARLCPDLAARMRDVPARGAVFSRIDAVQAAAARLGCTVLLKGPDTVVAHPLGEAVVAASVRDRAVPWLATAGAGDVLAGMIAGLLARGIYAFDAAESAAVLHAEAARQFGPGLTADDLPGAIPAALRACLPG